MKVENIDVKNSIENAKKQVREDKGKKRRPGAQVRHKGSTLTKIDKPDEDD